MAFSSLHAWGSTYRDFCKDFCGVWLVFFVGRCLAFFGTFIIFYRIFFFGGGNGDFLQVYGPFSFFHAFLKEILGSYVETMKGGKNVKARHVVCPNGMLEEKDLM